MPALDEWDYRVKLAFQVLVKAIGTNEAAAAICGVTSTTIHRYGDISPGNDHLPPLRMVMALEGACGSPIVTTVMADKTSHRLIPSVSNYQADCILAAQGRILKIVGKSTVTVGEAAEDREYTPNELKRIQADWAEIVAEVNQAQGTAARLHVANDVRRSA